MKRVSSILKKLFICIVVGTVFTSSFLVINKCVNYNESEYRISRRANNEDETFNINKYEYSVKNSAKYMVITDYVLMIVIISELIIINEINSKKDMKMRSTLIPVLLASTSLFAVEAITALVLGIHIKRLKRPLKKKRDHSLYFDSKRANQFNFLEEAKQKPIVEKKKPEKVVKEKKRIEAVDETVVEESKPVYVQAIHRPVDENQKPKVEKPKESVDKISEVEEYIDKWIFEETEQSKYNNPNAIISEYYEIEEVEDIDIKYLRRAQNTLLRDTQARSKMYAFMPIAYEDDEVLDVKLKKDEDEIVDIEEYIMDQIDDVFDDRYAEEEFDKKIIDEANGIDRSIQAKLSLSDVELQNYYETIKNHILSFELVRSKISWNFDIFKRGAVTLAKATIKGNTLSLYLALNPKEYVGKRHELEDFSMIEAHRETPLKIDIKNSRYLSKAIELVDEMMEKAEIPYVEKQDTNYHTIHKLDETLIDQGLVKEKEKTHGYDKVVN